jgi:predicted nucleotidyltransferase
LIAMDAPTALTAQQVKVTLRKHAAELRQAGIRHVGLFGSLARGEACPTSDIDLVVELDPAARIGLIRLAGIERRLAKILGSTVDLLPEPIEQPRIRADVDRDRQRVF